MENLQNILWNLPSFIIASSAWLFSWFFIKTCIISPLWKSQKSKYIQHAISQAIVSAVHGALCGLVGILIVYQCVDDVIHAQTSLVGQYIIIGCGYFAYDTFVMYNCYLLKLEEMNKKRNVLYNLKSFLKSRFLMILHHFAMVFFFFPIILRVQSMGNFMTECFFIMELSSVFVNFRFILVKINLKNSRIYILNGLCILFTFGFCRVLIFPIMYLIYALQQSSIFNLSYSKTLKRIPYICNLSCLFLFGLQVYWFFFIVKGTIRTIANRSKESVVEKMK